MKLMSQKKDFDLYGEYTPEPFAFKGNARSLSIVAAAIAVFITGIILTNSKLANVEENENYPLYNLLIMTGVVLLTLFIGYLIAKMLYKKNLKEEREIFYRMKKEAEPYIVCEFCGGRIERKFYPAEDTIMSRYNNTKLGIETFVCNECRYLVKGHTATKYLAATSFATEYSLVLCEVFETSKVSEEELTKGRLMKTLKSARRVGYSPRTGI